MQTAAAEYVCASTNACPCNPFSLQRRSSFLAQPQPSEFSIWQMNAAQLLIEVWYPFLGWMASRVTSSRVVFCFEVALVASLVPIFSSLSD